MKKLVVLTVILGLFVMLSPASAVTRAGKATPTRTPTWNIMHGPGGMLIVTVYWKTKSANLYLVGACDDGATFVSGSMADRFTRVQVEVDPGTRCEVEARSRRGTTKFYANFRGSGIFDAASGQEAIVVTTSDGPSPILDELAKLGKASPPR